MKTAVVLVLCTVAAVISAEDDGQYRPGKYGDDGSYKATVDGRYVGKYYDTDYYKNIYEPVYARNQYQNDYYSPYGRHYQNNLYYPQYAPQVYRGLDNRIYQADETVVIGATAKPILASTFVPPVVSSTPFAGLVSPTPFSRVVYPSPFSRTVPSTFTQFVTPSPFKKIVSPTIIPVVSSTAIPPAVYPGYKTYYGNAESSAPILRQESDVSENGYQYAYETANNIKAAETGQVEKTNDNGVALRANGFYEYVGDDGKTYRVDYRADENGFVAAGAHLPTPPPTPEAIARSLAYLKSLGKA